MDRVLIKSTLERGVVTGKIIKEGKDPLYYVLVGGVERLFTEQKLSKV